MQWRDSRRTCQRLMRAVWRMVLVSMIGMSVASHRCLGGCWGICST